jgi:hypothetical protein
LSFGTQLGEAGADVRNAGVVVDDVRGSGKRSRSVVVLYGEREEKQVTGYWTPAGMEDISVRPMSARRGFTEKAAANKVEGQCKTEWRTAEG